MSLTSVIVAARPEDVWAVLANPRTYPRWVVGAQRIRGIEGDWPTPGSRFFHAVGFGPFRTKDWTRSLEEVTGRRLVMHARMWPFGSARVEVELEEVEHGTRITMAESPVRGPVEVVYNRLLDRLIHLRNVVSLRRLGVLAARRPRVR
ncbi:MAG TPA: SRPBCC family protein [Mycobacteriales bacterium]|nr:SRPBCC family protein [Mycobacteriales bacterium]